MPIRMVEVTVPAAELPALREVLDGSTVLDTWDVAGDSERPAVRVLVPLEGVEAFTDLIQDRLEGAEGLRLTVIAVEATLPSMTESEGENGDDEEAEGSSKGDPLRVSREELYQDLDSSIRVSPVYLATVGLSTVVAAVGMLRNDVAVVIGAMVIAPLLGPNVALALAAALGDTELAIRSLKANLAGVGLALVIAVGIGLLTTIDPTAPQLASRTTVGLADVALALAAGSAGSLAYTTGLPTAVVGVMVAVALLPPLVATGVLAGAGYLSAAVGAGILLMTNVTCVNLAGVATFLAQRVRPRTWWEAERAKRAVRVAMATWVVTLAALVGIMFWLW